MLAELIIFLILYAVLVFTDLVPVYKAKNKKTILLCTGIFAIAFVFQVLIIFNVDLPRHTKYMEIIVEYITGYSMEK